ncbi:MAG: hypothetical protein NVS4B2_08750 [Chloroflexota bacterium]
MASSSARRLLALVVLLCVSACSPQNAVHIAGGKPSTPTPLPTATPPPSPTPIPPPQSWMKNTTLFTLYGRALGTAPILGRLGMDNNMADVATQARPFLQGIRSQTHGRAVRIALHLIYGMATPCYPRTNCLLYLDDSGVNIVKQYIEPAARRGWLVILDDQLGGSAPKQEMARIIRKGYLRYDNVAVGLDPEFRSSPGQYTPGIPVGTVTGREINDADTMLNRYAVSHPLPHRKVVLIHQFQVGMVQQRGSLKVHLPWVDPVIVMDGFGDPGVKAHVYHDLLGARHAPRIRWRGIKLFYPNPYEQAGHADDPIMTWPQVFGHAPALDVDGIRYWVSPAPQVVVVA